MTTTPLTNEIGLRNIPLTTEENLSLQTYFEQVKDTFIRLDNPFQRFAEQWGVIKKSNLVRRVLQGGKFLPLLICTQTDKNGCEVRWLIDGKQRITGLQAFMDGKFPISSKTFDYMVTYDGILYETKKNKNGKFGLKKNSKGELIPILDDDGNRQKVRQTIDIRGLYYKDLPPELKRNFKNYMMPAQVKHNCTDEDIILEIIDYNSGAPMNVAQLGKSRLGAKLAPLIVEISEHRFILDRCGFTAKNKIKGIVERSIGEALALISFGSSGWIKDYNELCLKMADCVSEEDINKLKYILDKLEEITYKTKELREHMVNKEFFIVIANFAYFLEKDYKAECYADFLQKFVSEIKYQKIINTHDLDENGNEIFDSYISVYEKSTKDKNVIESRLNQMNEWLDTYLNENCADMIEEDVKEEAEAEELILDKETENEALLNYAQEFDSDEAAIKTLAIATDNPYSDFEIDSLRNVIRWFEKNGNNDTLDDIRLYKMVVSSSGIKEDDENLPMYVYAIKYLYSNDIEIDENEWLSEFKKSAFKDIDVDENSNPNSSTTIELKRQAVINSIKNFAIKARYTDGV